MKKTETSLFIRRLSENIIRNNIKETQTYGAGYKAKPDPITKFVVGQQLELATLALTSKLQLNDNLKFPTWIKDCHKAARHNDNKVGEMLVAWCRYTSSRWLHGSVARVWVAIFWREWPGYQQRYSAQSLTKLDNFRLNWILLEFNDRI